MGIRSVGCLSSLRVVLPPVSPRPDTAAGRGWEREREEKGEGGGCQSSQGNGSGAP
jgi:hypothetical protein